jgi:hypothetical protein
LKEFYVLVTQVPIDKLRNACDPKLLQCESTRDLKPLAEIVGQERAIRALKFGLGIKNHGINNYVSGYTGTGKRTAVKIFVDQTAQIRAP